MAELRGSCLSSQTAVNVPTDPPLPVTGPPRRSGPIQSAVTAAVAVRRIQPVARRDHDGHLRPRSIATATTIQPATKT
jgi:hypothetical protein